MRIIAQTLATVLVCFIAGCVSSTIRLPASFQPKYNSKIVNSLKNAATNGVLFQVSEGVFRDIPSRQVDRCRKVEPPTWSAVMISLLDILDKNPQYFSKFHIVDFKRGDKTRVEISKDIDGLSYLNIMYSKRELHEKVGPETTLPCQQSNAAYLGMDLVTTHIDWPVPEELNQVLKKAQIKSQLDRFKFNTEFLQYLAERQTILKVNPEVVFERTYQGEYFLGTWLEKMAEEIKQNGPSLDHLNYWLKEISINSKQAATIQFFGLYPESSGSYGVQVDTVGKFSRKLGGFQEPTYLFMTYNQRQGEYIYNNLKDLNQCLQKLTGIYRNPLVMGTTLEADEDSFLSPGFSCKPDSEE